MADSSGLNYGEEYFHNARAMNLFTCRWLPTDGEPKALVFLCHGYGMECSVYTRPTAVRLARAGYAVYGIDYEGHGKSQGLRCYIPSFSRLVDDCEAFFTRICNKEEYVRKPRFIYGESMGGAAALLLSQRVPSMWSGLVLVAPMCKISKKMSPPAIVTAILKQICRVFPTWKIVPTKNVIDNAYRDPIKREEIRSNPMAYLDQPRLLTALQLVETTTKLEQNLDKVVVPFLCLHGEADTVTDLETSKALYNKASTPHKDKDLIVYPGMWHGLTTGETDENVEKVFADIIRWLDGRSEVGEAAGSPQLGSVALAEFEPKLLSRSATSNGPLMDQIPVS